MAKKTQKSGLAAKLGTKGAEAVKTHRSDAVNYGQIDLPGGIRNGIAKLVECKFGIYKSGANQGEYYFLAAGTVVSPATITTDDGEIPVAGLRTQIMEPVCDTTKRNGEVVSIDSHVATVMNELQKLGLDVSDAELEDLEDLVEVLKESAPYFRFATSQSEATAQYPNPRVWENWNGGKGLEDYEPEVEDEVDEDDEDLVEDSLENEDEDEDEDNDSSAESEEDDSNDEELSWTAKGAATDDSDDDSDYEEELEAAALAAGIDQDDIDNANDWVAVGTLIDDSDDEKSITPEKGESYSFKPPKAKKAIAVTVTAVFAGKQTCNVKSDAGKTYKGVTYDKLSN